MYRVRKRMAWLWGRVHGYQGRLPETVDQRRVLAEAADFFHLSPSAVQAALDTYRALDAAQSYAATLGESKTLTFDEAFLLYLAAARVRPADVVEIGSQHGKSTRRILDMLAALGIPPRVTCFDVLDELRFVDHAEVTLVLKDVTYDVTAAVLDAYSPALIFLDARPYHLLYNGISEYIMWSQAHPSILAIHDCTPALYNPHMLTGRDDFRVISSETGVWERYALADAFAVTPAAVDDVHTATHRLRVFSTVHGLALIAPNSLLTDPTRTP